MVSLSLFVGNRLKGGAFYSFAVIRFLVSPRNPTKFPGRFFYTVAQGRQRTLGSKCAHFAERPLICETTSQSKEGHERSVQASIPLSARRRCKRTYRNIIKDFHMFFKGLMTEDGVSARQHDMRNVECRRWHSPDSLESQAP